MIKCCGVGGSHWELSFSVYVCVCVRRGCLNVAYRVADIPEVIRIVRDL